MASTVISSVPLKHILLRDGNRENYIPVNRKHAWTSCCAIVLVLIFGGLDEQVKWSGCEIRK